MRDQREHLVRLSQRLFYLFADLAGVLSGQQIDEQVVGD